MSHQSALGHLLSLSFVCDLLSLIGVACINLYLKVSRRRSKKLMLVFGDNLSHWHGIQPISTSAEISSMPTMLSFFF